MLFSTKSPLIVTQTVINSVIGYIGLYFITQYVGADAWGFLAFAMGFAGVLSLITDLGYSQAHIKNISEGKEIGKCNGTFLAIKMILGSIFVAIVIISLLVWTQILHRGFQNAGEFWVILAITPYFFFSSLTGFANSTFSAKLHPARMVIPSMVEAILRNSIFILLGTMYYFHIAQHSQIYSAIILAGVYSATYTIYFTISLIVGRPWDFSRPSARIFKRYSALAIPLAISASLSTVNGNIDKVIIQFYWHAVATGAFYLDQRIVQSLSILSSSLSVFFLPLLSRINKPSESESFRSSIVEFERMVSLFVLPFVVVFSTLSLYIVNIFSAAFISYSSILTVLAVNVYFAVTTTPYSSALVAKGMTRVIAKISVMAVTMNIILNFVLVPQEIFGFSTLSLGVIGAAVSSLVATLFSNIMLRVILYRSEKVGFSVKIFKQLLPTVVQVALVLFILMFIKPYDVIFLVPVALVTVGAFFGISILVKEISFKQLWTFAMSLNPFKLLKRLSEEGS